MDVDDPRLPVFFDLVGTHLTPFNLEVLFDEGDRLGWWVASARAHGDETITRVDVNLQKPWSDEPAMAAHARNLARSLLNRLFDTLSAPEPAPETTP